MLNPLITLHDEMTGLVAEEIEVNVVYLNFSKAFDTISSNIDKMTK